VLLIPLLTLILFDSKVTYFVVALSALALLSADIQRERDRVIAAVLLTLIVALGLEVGCRLHKSYFSELVIVLLSSGLSRGERTCFNYKDILFLLLFESSGVGVLYHSAFYYPVVARDAK
jgi:hypothetical protein